MHNLSDSVCILSVHFKTQRSTLGVILQESSIWFLFIYFKTWYFIHWSSLIRQGWIVSKRDLPASTFQAWSYSTQYHTCFGVFCLFVFLIWVLGTKFGCSCLYNVFVSVSIAVIKYHNQKQVGEERVNLAYTSILETIIERSQDRNPNKTGIWRQVLMQRS